MVNKANVSVRWSGKKYDVEANLDDSPLLFKAQMFALTGVQPERQKIMFKGKTLTDDAWGALGGLMKDGSQLMMMGSADAVPDAPKHKTVFVEDMTDAQLARALDVPAGLKNLGNTCYMNATLQCLKTVPELTDALKQYAGNPMSALANPNGGSQSITSAVRDVFQMMDQKGGASGSEVVPLIMVQILHMVLPRFAEKDDHGHPQQQDANECWTEIVRMLQTKLPLDDSATVNANNDVPTDKSLITKYFGGRFNVNLKCKELPATASVAEAGAETSGAVPQAAASSAAEENDDVSKSTEDFLQLSCFLSQDVKYLQSGMKAKLVEEITKRSVILGRDAVFERRSEIDRLPAYLTVQIVRFYYKEKDQVNAKILKDVKFPLSLDVYDMCSDELKKKLQPMRERMAQAADKQSEIEKKIKMGEMTLAEVTAKKKKKLPFSFPDDVGSNNSGNYELQAVLTHKGRSSNSGHYVGWVKQTKDQWLMCDDDEIHPVTTEEILKLSGGGDWHCAYLLLYGPKILEVDEVETSNGEQANGTTSAKTMEH